MRPNDVPHRTAVQRREAAGRGPMTTPPALASPRVDVDGLIAALVYDDDARRRPGGVAGPSIAARGGHRMGPTDAQVADTVERCEAVMGRYHKRGRAPGTRGMMAAEVLALAAWAVEAGLTLAGMDAQAPEVLSSRLLRRHGPEAGPRLYADFLRAFDDALREAGPARGRPASRASRDRDAVPGPRGAGR